MSKVRRHNTRRLVKKGSSDSEIKFNPTDAEIIDAFQSGRTICGFGSTGSDEEIVFIV